MAPGGNEWEDVDVLICGCGPTGAMLAAYLGVLHVSTIVLEREPDITTDPRGIALDEDGIRLLQGLGLHSQVYTEIGSCVARIRFVGGVHQDLMKPPFLTFDVDSSEGHTGHPAIISHKQPVLEKNLRSVALNSQYCQIRSSCNLTSIHEDEDYVYAVYLDSSGTQQRIRSRFFVGADGKTGYTRKQYLEPKGIRLDWAEATKYEETWVALNWKLKLPTKETHPSFPLWSHGYTSEQVFDLFFPAEFRFLCNPMRPAVCGRFGPPQDRLWRFEFVVAHDEDGAELAKPHKIREVVFPYITHPGHRYRLTEDITYPEDCIEVLRSRPFRFSARSCDRWALGRVILCGDAAHVFPPFGGQGIASGFRDAVALAWRLQIACSSRHRTNHQVLLEGWYKERKQQLEKSLAATVRNGDMVNSKNTVKIFMRNWLLYALQLFPSWKRYLERGPRLEGAPRYSYQPGMPFLPQLNGGGCFPQTYCTALSSKPGVQFTDDIIFAPSKEKIFQIVVLLTNINQLQDAKNDIEGLNGISDELSPAEATFFIPHDHLSTASSVGHSSTSSNNLFRSATADEFARSDLCKNRPVPRGYNSALMWQAVEGKRYVILRFDRFMYALCNSRAQLEFAAKTLADQFPRVAGFSEQQIGKSAL